MTETTYHEAADLQFERFILDLIEAEEFGAYDEEFWGEDEAEDEL